MTRRRFFAMVSPLPLPLIPSPPQRPLQSTLLLSPNGRVLDVMVNVEGKELKLARLAMWGSWAPFKHYLERTLAGQERTFNAEVKVVDDTKYRIADDGTVVKK